MDEPKRARFFVAAAFVMIGAAFAACAAVMTRWFRSDGASASASRAEAAGRLDSARLEFRRRLLDVRAHLRLSEALWRAGRPVDSFYVSHAARQIFGDEEFARAHAEAVLGAGGPAAQLRRRLDGLRDAALTVPIHAEIARSHPDAPEGRESLSVLTKLAAGDEKAAGGESAYLARAALEELHRGDPAHSGKLSALGMSLFARGDFALAHAVAAEALAKTPGQAGAAQIMGALALQRRDMDSAMGWLSAAWDRNPDDLYSASKLAQIYDKRRSDPESALPFYLALYRQNPYFSDGDTNAETRIRETLDARRESLLENVAVEGVGARMDLDDASLRAEACLRAAAFKDPRWIDKLGELLDDDAEIVRKSADYALFEIGKASRDALLERRSAWLTSPKPLVRIRALNLFADLEGTASLSAVEAALKDPDPAVRAFSKVMVLDHYYQGHPEAGRLRSRYQAEEKDPAALALLARFPARK